MNGYRKILDEFSKHGLEFLITGTWALKLAYPEKLKDYSVRDCDIIIKNDLVQIRKAVDLLLKNGWETTIWEEKIDFNITLEKLEGKYYIRARFQNHILDITYENKYYSWQILNDQKIKCEQFKMVSLEHILALKKIKGRPQDFDVIRLLT